MRNCKKTCDSLTALTPDVVEGYKEVAAEEPVEEETPKAEEVPAEAPAAPAAPAPVQGGVFKLHIGEGKDINLEIPVGIIGGEQQLRHLREYLHRSYRQYL